MPTSRRRFHDVVLLATLLGATQVAAQGLYTRALSSFEIVVPRKTSASGAFLSHHLDHHHPFDAHPRSRRSTPAEEPVVHYQLAVDGVVRQLDLWPNRRLLAPGARVERWRRGVNATTTPTSPHCHYHGVVRAVPASMVAVSACAGLSGLIRLPSGDFWLEPKRSATPSGEEHAHVVFRRSAVTTPTRKRKRKKKRKHERNCGTREPSRESRLEWRQHSGPVDVQARGKSRKARWRRSVSRERHVEALVVADTSMMAFHQDGDVETYLLTILNLVSGLYREPSIGHPVNVAVVRVVLLEDDVAERGLDVSVNASSTLDSFCRWQAILNLDNDTHPNHHDVAVLVTRADICARASAPCSTLGVAHVAGMCRPEKSCNVNEDNGITLAHTIAHELGHNFGMYHDTEKSGCSRRDGATLHVMTPSFEADTVEVAWSACSRRDITTFLERGLADCLEDEPGTQAFHYPELPPGAMYDAEHQCRLQFGDRAATVCTPLDEICSRLWCEVNGTCTTLLRPAAAGTHCGKHKWCSGQQCVAVGDRPVPVPGGWGAWGAWSACSRTCGAGVATLERRCDNPAPASGGRFCVGERRRHRVCNTHACPVVSSFRAAQCSQHDGTPYQGAIYKWLPYFDTQDPCELYCTDANDTLLVPWGAAADGTGCRLGAHDLCIGGACRRVGCDWQVDSDAVEDRCGVCRGDGSRCETVRGLYTRRDGSGYKEIVVVPAGARNVLVEEVGNSRNFIGIGSATSGKFFLNGKRQITIAGEYEIAGTPALYERERDNERVRIPGPLKESILIYLIFRGRYRNFGVRHEYTVLRAPPAHAPRYEWTPSDWTPCSATCGGGAQWTRPVCRDYATGAHAADERACAAGDRAAHAQSRPCNTHRCPPRWWTGPWQLCTASCASDVGDATRRRTVMCVGALETALPDAECDAVSRPREVEPCPGLAPCALVLEARGRGGGWATGRWGACVPACGPGVRRRGVTCVRGACDVGDKPDEVEACRAHRHCRHAGARGP